MNQLAMNLDPPEPPGRQTPTCPHCGQKIRKLNPHRMDFGKVKVLRAIAEVNLRHEWCKVQRDGNLIHADERDFTIQTDAIHASRLLWFGLVDRRDHRDGLYRINRNGIAFLAGRHFVPARIWCQNGRVIERDADVVSIEDVRGVILDKEYWDEYPAYQRYRGELPPEART